MAHYAVRESPPLRGEIPISTSKNAVLPIMCGALLTGEDVRIERVPELTDVKTLCALLASCGGADSPARRMRHRPAADRSAPQGHERARREGQI